MNSSKQIVLASTSPRRKQLLEQIGISFTMFDSKYEEDMSLDLHPKDLVQFLSKGKAESTAKHFPNSLIIAADTVVAFEDMVVSKPENPVLAKEYLLRLSGNTHSVFTGLTVIDSQTNKMVQKVVETKIYMRNFRESEIDEYINTGEPIDKAGGYGIQGIGAILVDKIEGDYNNVVGLPLTTLYMVLKDEFNIEPFHLN